MNQEAQQKIVSYFIEEAREHLNTIENSLLSLQSNIHDPELINELFRAAHSIKGGAAMLGFTSIQRVSHRMEDFFKIFRERTVPVDQHLETLLLRGFDTLSMLLEHVENQTLTDEVGAAALAEIEPVFQETETYIYQLLDEVPKTAAPAKPSLATVMNEQVPALLKQMVEAVKQAGDPRAALLTIANQVQAFANDYAIPGWDELLGVVKQAIQQGSDLRNVILVVVRTLKQASQDAATGKPVQVSADLRQLVAPPAADPKQSALQEIDRLLRGMLDAFKADPRTARSQWQQSLVTLRHLGSLHRWLRWVHLVEVLEQIVADPSQDLGVIVRPVLKDLKQGQRLLTGGEDEAIQPSEELLALVPMPVVTDSFFEELESEGAGVESASGAEEGAFEPAPTAVHRLTDFLGQEQGGEGALEPAAEAAALDWGDPAATMTDLLAGEWQDPDPSRYEVAAETDFPGVASAEPEGVTVGDPWSLLPVPELEVVETVEAGEGSWELSEQGAGMEPSVADGEVDLGEPAPALDVISEINLVVPTPLELNPEDETAFENLFQNAEALAGLEEPAFEFPMVMEDEVQTPEVTAGEADLVELFGGMNESAEGTAARTEDDGIDSFLSQFAGEGAWQEGESTLVEPSASTTELQVEFDLGAETGADLPALTFEELPPLSFGTEESPFGLGTQGPREATASLEGSLEGPDAALSPQSSEAMEMDWPKLPDLPSETQELGDDTLNNLFNPQLTTGIPEGSELLAAATDQANELTGGDWGGLLQPAADSGSEDLGISLFAEVDQTREAGDADLTGLFASESAGEDFGIPADLEMLFAGATETESMNASDTSAAAGQDGDGYFDLSFEPQVGSGNTSEDLSDLGLGADELFSETPVAQELTAEQGSDNWGDLFAEESSIAGSELAADLGTGAESTATAWDASEDFTAELPLDQLFVGDPETASPLEAFRIQDEEELGDGDLNSLESLVEAMETGPGLSQELEAADAAGMDLEALGSFFEEPGTTASEDNDLESLGLLFDSLEPTPASSEAESDSLENLGSLFDHPETPSGSPENQEVLPADFGSLFEEAGESQGVEAALAASRQEDQHLEGLLGGESFEDLFGSAETAATSPAEAVDDLQALFEQEQVAAEQGVDQGLDDLEDLFAESVSSNGIGAAPVATEATRDVDDLEALFAEEAPAAPQSQWDDLASLFEDSPTPAPKDDLADLEAELAAPPLPSVGSSLDDLAALFDEPAPPATPPIDDLEALFNDSPPPPPPAPPAAVPAAVTPTDRPAPTKATVRPAAARKASVSSATMKVEVKHLDFLNNLVGELVVNRNSLTQNQNRLRQFLENLLLRVQQLGELGQRMQDVYDRSLLEIALVSGRSSGRAGGGVALASGGSSQGLEALEMDQFTAFHSLSQEIIELIVRVRESASDIQFVVDEVEQNSRQFGQITTQLQEGLNRARMVPFSQIADRLPRAVRELSIKTGKQVNLEVQGRETLIDKAILEELYDPLTHLVNNALVHGIESPEVRRKAGKPPEGRITVKTFYQGNQTMIVVSDDGAGIPVEKVKKKAIAKGLISPNAELDEIYNVLFNPGFSGRDENEIDDLAGRGVGLDVVRRNINELRGTIQVDSTPGKGTTFTIRLPLTLSISKSMLCISDKALIAFPLDGVEEMMDVPKEEIEIDEKGRPTVQCGVGRLPFRPLSELLTYNRSHSRARSEVYSMAQDEGIVPIVVIQSGGQYAAIQVDNFVEEQEIVIKQLRGPAPKPVGIAGATVQGNGRVLPIADIIELVDLAYGRIRPRTTWEGDIDVEATEGERQPTVLIVDDSITVRAMLSMTFTKAGYRVEQARDGQDAWEKLRGGLPCDLVFCDIEMPRMDGLELLSRMREDAYLKNLPIAMLTSRGADKHRQLARERGANAYFTKPYLEEELLTAAQQLMAGAVLLT
ncbi:MAG: response regulator [Thermostichales cyanobacterium DRC_bins_46]